MINYEVLEDYHSHFIKPMWMSMAYHYDEVNIWDQLLILGTDNRPSEYKLEAVHLPKRVFSIDTDLDKVDLLLAELNLPNKPEVYEFNHETPFYLKLSETWINRNPPKPNSTFYVKGIVVRHRKSKHITIRISNVRTLEVDLKLRLAIKETQEAVMTLPNHDDSMLNMRDMVTYRAQLTDMLAEKCTAQIRELFDNNMPDFTERVQSAIRSNISANHYVVYIPRPNLPQWEDVNMDMYVLYMWNYKIVHATNSNGASSLNYDPTIDSIVYKFIITDAKFKHSET